MKKFNRTHYCGNLRKENIGQEVSLYGWVQKSRNLGSLIFIDLRDREGIVQIVVDETVNKEIYSIAKETRGEFVISVKGIVRERESKNLNIPTGEIEILTSEISIISESEVPPIHITDEDDANERLRLKYRYLDLRKSKMQKNLILRSKVVKAARDFLSENGFIDVETPYLTKPTPEGARDYLVPSRVSEGKFYALPQSPQIFKQLLMVSGFDKYYQIAKCFRDEDLRADRQPEFTQIDIEMSFVDMDDVMEINERLISHIFKESIGYEIPLPIRRMSYHEAMDDYGSDKPDLRYGFKIKKLDKVFINSEFKVFTDALSNGGTIRAINVNGYEDKFSRKDITALEELAKNYGAKGLSWIKFKDGEFSSSITKFLDEVTLLNIKEIMNIKDNDMILIAADKKSVVLNALGALRGECASRLGLINENENNFLWVTEFPLFEQDEETGRFVAKHHPFTSPVDEDMERILVDKENVRAKAYDLVHNGVEIGGGSIRIHRRDIQKKMFEALGFSDEQAQSKFGFLLDAFKYGTPPHGGIAFGLDRLIMNMAKTNNIREVIAFPKTQNATDLMSEAPGIADINQLEELHIKLAKEEINE
jgi:aspartyl-tRNA synthetase